MSMKLMVRVIEECDVSRPQQAVLLAMAENANDDGTRCYPSVDLIAWKAGYKPRNVVIHIRELRAMNILEVVAEATAQRPTEYRIHLANAPQKQTFEEWLATHGRHAERGPYDRSEKHENAPLDADEKHENAPLKGGEGCNPVLLGVQNGAFKKHENAPEPVNRPSQDPPPSPQGGRTRGSKAPVQDKFDQFWSAYPKRVKKQAAFKAFQHIDPDDTLLEQMIYSLELAKLSRQWRKDDGDFIPHPATWLNAGQWDDELTPDASASPSGPPDVQLLPGEVATEIGPGHWELETPDGLKRTIKPEYRGVVFDQRRHLGTEGLARFYAEVRAAGGDAA